VRNLQTGHQINAQEINRDRAQKLKKQGTSKLPKRSKWRQSPEFQNQSITKLFNRSKWQQSPNPKKQSTSKSLLAIKIAQPQQ
jgi:hypothetical protein